MLIATQKEIEGVYREIIDDDDFILDQSARSDIYERMKHRDSHVAACWQSRVIPIAAAPWRITSPSARQAKLLTEQIENFPDWLRYTQALMDGIFRGWAGVEWEFGAPGGECVVRDWVAIDQDYITFKVDGTPRLITQSHPTDGVDMPTPKFTVVSWGDQRHGNRRGKGVAQGVFWPWFFKHKGIKFWATALERFGTPGLKGKVKGGDKGARKTRWLQILRDYIAGTGVVYEDGEEVDILGQSMRIGDSHKAFEDFFNDEIALAVLGQTLTTKAGERGSYALGKVHAVVRDDIMYADSVWMGSVHSRHTLPNIGRLLFGDTYKPAKFEYLWEDADEGKTGAERLEVLKRVGLPMRKQDVYEIAAIPEPAGGEEVFEWPRATVPAAPVPQPAAPPETFSESGRARHARQGTRDVEDLSLASVVKAVESIRKNGLDSFKRRISKKELRD